MNKNRLFESESLELKRQFPSNDKLAIEMIALANTKGGRIIIGYDEKNDKIVGCPWDQIQEEKKIANIVNDLTSPKIEYGLSLETVEDKTLLTITIKQSQYKPHFLKNKDLINGTYIRIGSTSRLVDKESLARLIREGKNISEDTEKTSKKIELNKDLLKNLVSDKSLIFQQN